MVDVRGAHGKRGGDQRISPPADFADDHYTIMACITLFCCGDSRPLLYDSGLTYREHFAKFFAVPPPAWELTMAETHLFCDPLRQQLQAVDDEIAGLLDGLEHGDFPPQDR